MLGGEMRDVTLFFSDIVSFSSIAETMTPNALVALLNEYLSAMTDIIEEHGGYVEKYSGDSARFLLRAQQFAAHPPGPDWEPVFTLEGKWPAA